jgi:hypothetical protein
LLEAFSESPGRQAAIDRLFEYLFVLLIRSAMDAQQVDSGVLLGLSYSRLSGAIEAMHKHPETSWTLEELAQAAGMFQHQVCSVCDSGAHAHFVYHGRHRLEVSIHIPLLPEHPSVKVTHDKASTSLSSGTFCPAFCSNAFTSE